jgi:hypothetical protein
MKNKGFLFEFAASSLLILSLSGKVLAAPQAENSKVGGTKPAPSANTTVKPLQQVLKIQSGAFPSLCTVLNQAINDSYHLAYDDLQGAARLYQTGGSIPYIYFEGVTTISDKCLVCATPDDIQGCCSTQQSFSVQDQQAAGCAGNDTVQQCMDKLVGKCIKTVLTQKNLKTKLRQSQQKADAIATNARKLSDKLNQLLNALP